MIRFLLLPLILVIFGATGFAADAACAAPKAINAKCPVCGMAVVDTVATSKATITVDDKKVEVVVGFDAADCKTKFDADPTKYEAKLVKCVKNKAAADAAAPAAGGACK